jgi:hypothetical protein
MSLTPISKYDLTTRFRHQRYQFHSRIGGISLSPSLYRKILSFVNGISERIRCVLEAKASSNGILLSVWTLRLPWGPHLEVKKKSPWRSRWATWDVVQLFLLHSGVGRRRCHCLRWSSKSDVLRMLGKQFITRESLCGWVFCRWLFFELLIVFLFVFFICFFLFFWFMGCGREGLFIACLSHLRSCILLLVCHYIRSSFKSSSS